MIIGKSALAPSLGIECTCNSYYMSTIIALYTIETCIFLKTQTDIIYTQSNATNGAKQSDNWYHLLKYHKIASIEYLTWGRKKNLVTEYCHSPAIIQNKSKIRQSLDVWSSYSNNAKDM